MKRDDLIRDLRRYAKKNGKPFDILPNKGKGSHYTVLLGDKQTTLQSDEYTPLMIRRILDQLGIDPAAL